MKRCTDDNNNNNNNNNNNINVCTSGGLAAQPRDSRVLLVGDRMSLHWFPRITGGGSVWLLWPPLRWEDGNISIFTFLLLLLSAYRRNTHVIGARWRLYPSSMCWRQRERPVTAVGTNCTWHLKQKSRDIIQQGTLIVIVMCIQVISQSIETLALRLHKVCREKLQTKSAPHFMRCSSPARGGGVQIPHARKKHAANAKLCSPVGRYVAGTTYITGWNMHHCVWCKIQLYLSDPQTR